MSHRQLKRLKPHEVEAIIDARGAQIRNAHDAEKKLAERRELAERAKAELQYKPLLDAVKQETIEVPCDVVLLKALLRIGITPLEAESVRRYQNAMAGNRLNMLMKALGIPLLCAGFVGTVTVMLLAHNAPAFIARNPGALLWGWVLGVGCFLTWAEHALVRRKHWRKMTLDHYSYVLEGKSSLLPRPVIELALKVKEEAGVPCHFTVTHLELERGPWFKWFGWVGALTMSDPDPFLSVQTSSEAYYIAVWDEPGFDGRLMEVQ